MLLGIIIVVACAYLAGKAIQDARSKAWTGPRTPAMRSRSAVPKPASGAGRKAARSLGAVAVHPTNRAIRAQAKADVHRVWQETAATDWLEQQRHARQNGTGGTVTATAAPPKTKPTLKQRLRLVPFTATVPNPGNGGSNGQSANGATPTQPPAQGKGSPPGRPAPAPAQPAPPGGTPVAGTSTASAEKLIEGINEIHAHAQAGGIHAKQEAVKAAHEASVRFAAMVQMLARQMSEPGQNYGPEITEPLAQAGNHYQAGAMSLSESDAAISTLINMTVGDLARSPRQAPHHQELSESGSR